MVNGSTPKMNGSKSDGGEDEPSREERMTSYARENLVGTEAVVKGPFGRKQERIIIIVAR